MNHYKSIFLLVFVLAVISCSSVSELYDKGKYDSAFDKALKKLEKGDKKRENKEYLNKAFSTMLQRHFDHVNAFNEKSEIRDVEKEYRVNVKLIEKYHKAQRYLYAEHDSSAQQLTSNKEYLSNSLVDGYVLLAEEEYSQYEKYRKKRYAIKAHKYYLSALHYEKTDEMLSRSNEILEEAHTLVNIELKTFEFKHRSKIYHVFDRLKSSSTYETYEIDNWSSDADCEMVIDFRNLEDEEDVRRRTINYDERIIDRYETETDTSGATTQVPVYKNVEAEVELQEYKYTFEWDVSVEFDGDCLDMSDRFFSAQVTFEEEGYTTYGDERALPSKYQMNIEQRPNGKQAYENKAVEELLDELYNEIRRNYF